MDLSEYFTQKDLKYIGNIYCKEVYIENYVVYKELFINKKVSLFKLYID